MLYASLIAVALGGVLYFAIVARHVGVIRPDVVFTAMQLLAVFATAPQLNLTIDADLLYLTLMCGFILTFMVVNAAVHTLANTRRHHPVIIDRSELGVVGLVILIAGIGVVVAYYAAVGYSALLLGLSGALSGQDVDVATARLQSYAGERNLYPGYVNQFRNVLVPILSALFILQWHHLGKKRKVLSVALGAFAVFSLLGTAQRTGFIVVLIVLLGLLWQMNGAGSRRPAIWVGLASLPVLALSTFALGRGVVENQGSTLGVFLEMLRRLAERAVGGTADVEIRGFRYIVDLPIAYGTEWWQSLIGLLPGQRGSTLPNEIFALAYGSTRGNAQPSLWGSAYHNFGFLGSLIVAALLAAIFALLTHRMNNVVIRNMYELAAVSGISVTLGVWTSGGPTTPLNLGLLAYILLWCIGRNLANRRALYPPSGGPPAPDIPPAKRTVRLRRMSGTMTSNGIKK